MDENGVRNHPCGSANHLSGDAANMQMELLKGLDHNQSYPLLVATKVIKPNDEIFWDYFRLPGTPKNKRISKLQQPCDNSISCAIDSNTINDARVRKVIKSASFLKEKDGNGKPRYRTRFYKGRNRVTAGSGPSTSANWGSK